MRVGRFRFSIWMVVFIALMVHGSTSLCARPQILRRLTRRVEKSPDHQNLATDPPKASPAPRSTEYIIGPGDVLNITVWHEPQVSGAVPVRPDGKITVPLIGDLQAGNVTPTALQDIITGKLENYIKDPQVTVVVKQINSRKFNILGEIQKPGSYPLDGTVRVLDAIAVAGGFRDFAKKKNIYVLRQVSSGDPERFPFNYNEVVKGHDSSENIALLPGDTVVVP